MIARKVINIPVVAALIVVSGGCTARQTASNGNAPRPHSTAGVAQPAVAESAGRTIVYGLDITGSYALMQAGFEQAAQAVLREAKPGDIWYFRFINAKSYNDRAIILTVQFPDFKESKNPLARRKNAAARRGFTNLQAETAQVLRNLKPTPVKGTDIIGFCTKGGELLAKAPTNSERILVLATDLGDTLSRKGSVTLSGVRVIVTQFQSGDDPDAAAKSRGTWSAMFKKWGASTVTFADPSENALLFETSTR